MPGDPGIFRLATPSASPWRGPPVRSRTDPSEAAWGSRGNEGRSSARPKRPAQSGWTRPVFHVEHPPAFLGRSSWRCCQPSPGSRSALPPDQRSPTGLHPLSVGCSVCCSSIRRLAAQETRHREGRLPHQSSDPRQVVTWSQTYGFGRHRDGLFHVEHLRQWPRQRGARHFLMPASAPPRRRRRHNQTNASSPWPASARWPRTLRSQADLL